MYNKQQFDKCFFNPLEKNILKTYPELQEITQDERLLKFIILLYDIKSPLVRLYLDPKLRKQEAAQIAGYDLGKDDQLLESIYSFANQEARQATVAFLKKYQFPREWFMICANEQTLYEYGERMMEPISKGEEVKEKDLISAIAIKSKLSEDMESINKRIEAGYKKLFMDEEELIQHKPKTTAESMAMSV